MNYRVGAIKAAECLVMASHYSRRIPQNVQEVFTLHEDGGLFGDYGDTIAACFYTIPATRWSEPIVELARLVRWNRGQISLSSFVSWTVKEMKKRKYELLVSFADPTHGHHGGIYQACSWNYGGRRERRMDGLFVNGVFYPGRTCNHRFGTQSPVKLKEQHPQYEIEPHYDHGKYLYWKALNKEGARRAERLKLLHLPYPKPQMALPMGMAVTCGDTKSSVAVAESRSL